MFNAFPPLLCFRWNIIQLPHWNKKKLKSLNSRNFNLLNKQKIFRFLISTLISQSFFVEKKKMILTSNFVRPLLVYSSSWQAFIYIYWTNKLQEINANDNPLDFTFTWQKLFFIIKTLIFIILITLLCSL